MRIEVNGARLFFDVLGARLEPVGSVMREKPTLILLHGGPGFDHAIYRPAFDALSDIAQVIYLDHRGQGRSDYGEPAEWNLAQWADDVFQLCEALEIKSPIVFGHSFGGMVAMAYATRHPEQPGGLILSGTYARQDLEHIVRRFSEIAGEEVAEAARAFWSAPSYETNVEYRRLCMRHYALRAPDVSGGLRTIQRPEPCFHFLRGEMQTMDLVADLRRVRCPTLVIGSEGDPVCPIEGSEVIAAALPPQLARLVRLEGCRHVFWADAPAVFFGLLREAVAAAS